MSRRRCSTALRSSGSLTNRQAMTETMFNRGLPYSRKFTSHTSCVNYMAFSSNGGQYLATGGDDLDVHIWDFHQENLVVPLHTCVGPRRNIFTLAFSSTNKYLLAGGADNTIHKFDMDCLHSPDALEVGHSQDSLRSRDHIRSVSCHPFQDEVKSDDGRIVRHDQRSWNQRFTRDQDQIVFDCAVTDVKWHPTMEHLFVTSSEKGAVCLRDTRMAFGSSTDRTREGVVQTYNTKISKGSISHLSNPETSSLAFDSEGKKLIVTMLNFNPVVYQLSDPNPLAVCGASKRPDGSPVPEGQRSYSNSCTMKHGSIGSLGSQKEDFYCAGSDDFCAYIWKIPPVVDLERERKVVLWGDWYPDPFYEHVIGFSESLSGERYIPVALDTPLDRLTGHNSIVNTTLVHPSFPFVLTCGIEQHVFLHAPTPHLPFSESLERTPKEVRALGSGLGAAVANGMHDGEADTLSLFDDILQQEGSADPFLVRVYSSEGEDEDTDSQADEMESDESEDDAMTSDSSD